MSPAESLREKLIYFLEYAPHLKGTAPAERRAEAGRMVDAYAHELARQQRNWDAEAAGYTDPQMAVYAVADLIDPEADDDDGAGPVRPSEEPGT